MKKLGISVIILIKRDDTGGLEVEFGGGVWGVAGIEAIAGALLMVFIPEIAAFPDAGALTGTGTDGGGIVWHFPVL
jgi:hypothetical protein